jgi:hypothetical protein
MRKAEAIYAVQAGLLAGTLVAVSFFVLDLVELAPLSTPLALMSKLSLREAPEDAASPSLDLAALSEIASWVSLGGGLVALTTLHLLVFAVLSVAALAFFRWYHLPLNAATGAVFGLVVYSLVFEVGMAMVSPDLVVAIPGLSSIAGVNLLAGAIMGGYLKFRTRVG